MQRLFILTIIALVTATSFRPDDPSIFYSRYNWFHDSETGSIESANPGSFVKFHVHNATQLTIVLGKPALKDAFTTVAWFVDWQAQNETLLPCKDNRITISLDASKTHSIYFYIKNSLQSQDRWLVPNTAVKILSFETNDGATLSPSSLFKKNLLIYWDSIGEGVNTIPHKDGGDLEHNNALQTWTLPLAQALQAELGLVAFGGQGFTARGGGNIPTLWNITRDPNYSAWEWHNQNHRRNFSVCPDIVLNGHGTNDYFRGSTVDQMSPLVFGWLKSMRQTCKETVIFQVVPFGGFEQEAIQKGFQLYKNAVQDEHAHLINLGEVAAHGLQLGSSWCAWDGVHPEAWRSSQLGSLLTAAILPHLLK